MSIRLAQLGDTPLNTRVLRAAKLVATEQGMRVPDLFDDSLAGDVARFRVRRLVRGSADPMLVGFAIREMVTP